ncbi:hypothetical protein FOZ63_012793 [Perkinsus olseni]|uniref:Peptidase A1 domain-containing protein n=1 Tax=Perkinsus olseni TaxID=32597 RepID=A0A7J6R709_PEROL|nr:hypothetical protein FOZ62_001963 [Perkinsus olseni]KAF4721982.1 hypothetical protein FOZ63_012793 [Perkinsus olseni]
MHSHVLQGCVGLFIASVEAEPISLPVTEEYVPLTVDDQTLNFRVDTGSARTFAIYGPMYEERHGKGSCDEIPSKCYFCPTNVSCDDIYTRKRWAVSSRDGDRYEYEYVQHNVTIALGNETVPDFELGLVVKYGNIHGIHKSAYGLLGLSVGRGNIPETFLEQLKRRQVISNLVYSIHAKEEGSAITGNLTLNDSELTEDLAIPFSYHATESSRRDELNVPLWSLRLFDSQQNVLTQHDWRVSRRTEHGPSPGYIDTRASSIQISEEDFGTLVNATKAAMERDKLDSRYMIWEEPTIHYNMIRREATPYLPTLGFVIGEPPNDIDIRIEPKHYASDCYRGTCFLDINQDRLVWWGTVLGQPLFRAYDVKVDLSNSQLSFSSHGGSSRTAAKTETAQPRGKKGSLVGRLFKQRKH